MPSANRSDLLHSVSLGMMDAVFEMKLQGQRILSHALQDPQDKRLINFAAGNHLIAMVAILKRQIIGFNGFPKRNVIMRFQPLFDVLNVMKNHHTTSVPNYGCNSQTYLIFIKVKQR